MFEEKAAKKGHSSLVTEAHMFVEELGTSLTPEHSDLSCNSHKGSEGLIEGTKVKEHLKKAAMDKLKKKNSKPEKWHAHLPSSPWQDEGLREDGCFARLREWTSAPIHTIAGVMEL